MAASVQKCVCQMSRLFISAQPTVRTFVTQRGPAAFRHSPVLWGEPLKKRKKVDQNLVIQREQKKRRKLEKAIKRLVEKGRNLKPCDEIEGDRHVLKTLQGRDRAAVSLSYEESEQRSLLRKEWTRYKLGQYLELMRRVNVALQSQQRALDELRGESEELYQQAIQVDPEFVPFETKGPLGTPPVKDYDAPDGDYIDTTTVFDK